MSIFGGVTDEKQDKRSSAEKTIEQAKKEYNDAKARGDKAGMDAAHAKAEKARREGGISNDDSRYGNNPDTYKGSSGGGRSDREDNLYAGGYKVSRDKDGNYVYTDTKYGTRYTTTFAPNETIRRGGDGFDHWNPILAGAATARGVNLSTVRRGGQLLTTDQVDESYLGRNGGYGMDYTRRHMNPLEFLDAYTRERSGQAVDWDKEGRANAYSPVPNDIRQWQDYNRAMGYDFNGNQGRNYQMPQQQDWLSPLMALLGGYGGYSTFPAYGGGYSTLPAYGGDPWSSVSPITGGFNPTPGQSYNPRGPRMPIKPPYSDGGGMMYAGGTPYFNEQTGQYTNPNPTGGYNYGGINPGGMYSGGYMGGYDNNAITSMLLSLFSPTLFGGSYY